MVGIFLAGKMYFRSSITDAQLISENRDLYEEYRNLKLLVSYDNCNLSTFSNCLISILLYLGCIE